MLVKLPDTRWVFGVRFLIEAGIFIFAIASRPHLEPSQSCTQEYRGLFLGSDTAWTWSFTDRSNRMLAGILVTWEEFLSASENSISIHNSLIITIRCSQRTWYFTLYESKVCPISKRKKRLAGAEV
jgi:hypothetical protein